MDGTQMRFDEGELDIIRAAFKDAKVLKLLRKVFLPEYDPTAPLGQTVHFPWLGMESLSQMAPTDREIWFMSTIRLTKHIENQLLQLSALANMAKETPEQATIRQKKGSNR